MGFIAKFRRDVADVLIDWADRRRALASGVRADWDTLAPGHFASSRARDAVALSLTWADIQEALSDLIRPKRQAP